jgi:hypothetical protein
MKRSLRNIMGKLGASKGRKAKAEKLSPKKRKEIAQLAAKSRRFKS